ncbi:hypothetical protein MB02_06155 [Croceicoccus estronivorus]|uniref:vWA domain-containing protein n=1 Tax=Croceicoccus estronivorus TaxID=1172626 RepID=UPI000830A3D6|nr:VWA domain-containing protein [Croceicoccus estronivorus]OCC25015.1 hypothetical protein MB02_06155 [Croceicoccus estronivorus]
MRLAQFTTTTCLASLLAGCATQPEGNDIVVTGQRNETTTEGAPPPSPPPVNIAGAPPLMVKAAPMRAAPGYYVPPVMVATDPGRERYDGEKISPVKLTVTEPVSTFSVDVDTGSYANTRRFLTQGALPPKDAVRTEEMVNYFRYSYPVPEMRSAPFTVSTDLARTPWNPETRLLRIGLRGYDLPRKDRPPANLVFLVDVSGSMNSQDKLPLVKAALSGLAGELGEKDKVSIVVYAGAAGMVLEPTNDTRKIRDALDRLQAGGSTAGGAGLQLAYQIAEDNRIQGGVNRVILATDGDFNVGISNRDALIEMIEKERDSGITLTTLGFGTGNYNEAMMEQIADHGNGNYAYIDSALEARKVLTDEMASTLFTIAKDVKIQVEFNPASVSQYRLLGYENRALREEDFDNDKVDAGEIGAGHQVTAIYEIVPAGAKGWIGPRRYGDKPAPAGATKPGELAYVKLRYKLPDGDTSRLIERVVPAAGLQNSAMPHGDMAFAAAVAAYGQKLRGDPLLGDFSYRDIAALAGKQSDFWRQEFIRLTAVADGLSGN